MTTAVLHSPRRTRAQASTCAPGEDDILRGVLSELQQLREERRQEQEERLQAQAVFEARLQQRDEAFLRMERRLNELSPSENILNSESGLHPVNESREGVPVLAVGFREELGYKLKPDTFDGGVPLREFFSQFDLIARANRWSDSTKTVALASCLRGKARSILECVQDFERMDYAELRAKLELRFGEGNLAQNYYSQFVNRRQKFGEDLATLGSEIERLSRLAYPECPFSVRDKLACAQFIIALSDSFIKSTLQLEGVISLDFAVERAKAIKTIQGENSLERKV